MELRFLIFGDVMGRIGREAILKALPELKQEYKPDLVLANAENLAHGKGVTLKTIREMHKGGIDFFTSGNHIFNNPGVQDVWSDPELKDILIRPSNFPGGTAGEGKKMLSVGEKKVLVINLICQVFMKEDYGNPFKELDSILNELSEKPDVILVDMHGEASSERIAFGLYADGRVSAVTGTHTHVPTADPRILSNGTAYLTDIGMTGARESVLGVSPEGPLSMFVTGKKAPFKIPAEGPVDLNCVLITVDAETGKAVNIEQIQKIIE